MVIARRVIRIAGNRMHADLHDSHQAILATPGTILLGRAKAGPCPPAVPAVEDEGARVEAALDHPDRPPWSRRRYRRERRQPAEHASASVQNQRSPFAALITVAS